MGDNSVPKSEIVGPSSSTNPPEEKVEMEREENEEEPLISIAECRICQEEDSLNNLENPCACSGSLKYAHRKCVQHWCDEKGDITCEICHQPYQPGYTAPQPDPEETIIDIEDGWHLSGTPLDLHNARLLAIAEGEHQLLEAEYDDYHSTSGAAFCRSAALILIALLLLRHALSVAETDDDNDDPFALFSVSLLRAAGFLLPCYIMIWAISVLHHRRQEEEAAALAAPHFAVVLQSGEHRGLHFAIASAGPPPAPPTGASPQEERVSQPGQQSGVPVATPSGGPPPSPPIAARP